MDGTEQALESTPNFLPFLLLLKKYLTSIWWIPIPDLMHVFRLTTVSISLQTSQVDLEITFEEKMKKLLALSIWQQLKLEPEKSHILFIGTCLSFSLL